MLDGQGEQGRLEFEVGLVGQDGLRLGISLQLLRSGCGRANKVCLVGNVGHDEGTGRLQASAEHIVQRRTGLHHVGARVALGTQMLRDRQGQGLGGVEQGVFEQEGGRAADQLAKGRRGVA